MGRAIVKASKQARKAIKRTNDIMKAMSTLDALKQRITAIQDALEKDEFNLKETCYEIVFVGVKIQKVSSLVRPYTKEGNARIIQRNLRGKFERQVEKHRLNKAWLLENCVKSRLQDNRDLEVRLAISNCPTALHDGNFGHGTAYLVPSKIWLEENA